MTHVRQRLRLTGALFFGNALSSTAFLAVVTVAALAAQELTGSPKWAGLPSALSTVGAALGAWALTSWSRKVGRRTAFSAGFGLSAVGGAIGVVALQEAAFGVLLLALFVLGFGRSVSQLSRFAAGDLWPDQRRATALGFVVWAATIGSVVGPLLIVPASVFGETYLDAGLAGPFALAGVGFGLSALWYFVMLRPEPLELAVVPETSANGEADTARSLRQLLRSPSVQLAFLVLMVSQFVMILVMTMTPVHIQAHHHGLSLVSSVMMVHTLGMFAIAPLTGGLVDRLGSRWVIGLGALLLAISALLSATTEEAQPRMLTLSLFLLGVGWNFGFVAGSVALQEGLTLRERLRVQGLADAMTWISGGVAALASGLILAAGSFRGLSLLAAGIALVPALALLRRPGKTSVVTGARPAD